MDSAPKSRNTQNSEGPGTQHKLGNWYLYATKNPKPSLQSKPSFDSCGSYRINGSVVYKTRTETLASSASWR